MRRTHAKKAKALLSANRRAQNERKAKREAKHLAKLALKKVPQTPVGSGLALLREAFGMERVTVGVKIPGGTVVGRRN